MEDLTKTQIILLSLLVSFITSIATGIMTVSLLSEAPIGVTQTINRVVERTIEKVAPDTQEKVREVTVVVKEDDFVVDALKKNQGGLFRIYERDSEGKESFYGMGVAIAHDSLLYTDTSGMSEKKKYFVVSDKGGRHLLNTSLLSEKNQFQGLKIENDTANNALKVTPFPLADPDSLSLGQTVILLSGKDRDQVTVGLVSSLLTEIEKPIETTNSTTTKPTVKKVLSIETNVYPRDDFFGSPLLNSKGELVGLRDYSPNNQNKAIYFSVSRIKN